METLIESAYLSDKSSFQNLPDLIANTTNLNEWSSKKRPDLLKSASEPVFMSLERSFAQDDEDRPKLIRRVGSVRGRKNAVRDAIDKLNVQKNWMRNYAAEDLHKVVVYMTSLRVVRKTWEKCRRAVIILEQNRIKFDRRDLNMSRVFIDEFKNRYGSDTVELPMVYINGHLFGDDNRLEKYNENGELTALVKPHIFPCGLRSLCEKCFGFRFLPCPHCGGGKRSSLTYTAPDKSQLNFRCVKCDDAGLIMCEDCIDGFQDEKCITSL